MAYEITGKIASTLRQTPLLASLNDPELGLVAARSSTRSYAAGELLFSEGEPCRGLYVVMSGRIRIFKSSRSGREQVLAIEGAGSSVAELPVFDGGDYPASALAIEPSEIILILREDLRALCLESPELSLKLLQVVGSRLRQLVAIIEELSFTTLRGRLISWLLRTAKKTGKVNGESVSFELGVTHQEIASQIGTVRELVSRNMARLQAEGLIQVNGHHILVPDRAALQAEVDPTL
jgi:CRP/FNR family transcriptional regulator, cyclic AMP receptor protein